MKIFHSVLLVIGFGSGALAAVPPGYYGESTTTVTVHDRSTVSVGLPRETRTRTISEVKTLSTTIQHTKTVHDVSTARTTIKISVPTTVVVDKTTSVTKSVTVPEYGEQTRTVHDVSTTTLHQTTVLTQNVTIKPPPSYETATKVVTEHDTTSITRFVTIDSGPHATKVSTVTHNITIKPPPSYETSTKVVTEHDTTSFTKFVTVDSGPHATGVSTVTRNVTSTRLVTENVTLAGSTVHKTVHDVSTRNVTLPASTKVVTKSITIDSGPLGHRVTTVTHNVTLPASTRVILETQTKSVDHNVTKSITATHETIKYSTVVSEKVLTSVATRNVTKTISEKGTTKVLTTATPTTIRITQTKTIVKDGTRTVSILSTKTQDHTDFVTRTTTRDVTHVSTRPASTITKDHTTTSKITYTKGETVTDRYTTTVLKEASTSIKTVRVPTTITEHPSVVTSISKQLVTVTGPIKYITLVSTKPGSTVTHDIVSTRTKTLVKDQTVTIGSKTTIVPKPTTVIEYKTSVKTEWKPASTYTTVVEKFVTTTASAKTSTILKTKTESAKASTILKTKTESAKTSTIFKTLPEKTLTHDVYFTSTKTLTKGETITIGTTKTVLQSPSTITRVSTKKTTQVIPASTVTSIVVSTHSEPAKTVTYVSTLPASTLTETRVSTRISTCTEGQTITLSGGKTTVLKTASPTTVWATTEIYTTLPGTVATITQKGETIYRDVVVPKTTTLTIGETITVSGSSTSVLKTPHVTVVNVTVVTSYCPPKSTSAATGPGPARYVTTRETVVVTPTPLPVPAIFPQCLETIVSESSCSSTTDCGCYCKSPEYVASIIKCIDTSGGSSSDVERALSFFQGICAPYVPHNPAIITAMPSSYTPAASKEDYPYTTVSLQTVVTEECTLRACQGPSTTKTISTCITAPAVTFGSSGSGSVPILPATTQTLTNEHVLTYTAGFGGDGYSVGAPTFTGQLYTPAATTGITPFRGAAGRVDPKTAIGGLVIFAAVAALI